MRVLKSIVVLGILAIGLLAVQSAEAQARPWRFNIGFQYYNPGPYYYPAPATYYYGPAVVTPYAVPAYPTYYWSSGAVYQMPGRAPVVGRSYYQQGVNPYGVPYYGGYYYYRR